MKKSGASLAKKTLRKLKASRSRISDFILENISNHPNDIVILTMQKFGVTRPAVHKHLKNLKAKRLISKTGNTKNVAYATLSDETRILTYAFKLPTRQGEGQIWEQHIKSCYGLLPKNVVNIWHYGITEMVNNAIDHSEGSKVQIEVFTVGNSIKAVIADNGVGIFNKIANVKKLADPRESVLHLSKGKFTSLPERHSGEGIFFTSKIFDQFSLISQDIKYLCSSLEDDWTVVRSKEAAISKGTRVEMILENKSQKELKHVFDKFTD